MNLFSLPNIVASFFLFSMLIFVAIQTRNRWNERVFSFLAFCFTTAIWQITYGLSYCMTNENSAFKLLKIGYAAVIFMPVTFLHFVSSFLGKGKTGSLKILIRASYFLSAAFLLLHFSGHFLDGTYHYFFGYYPKAYLPVHLPFMLLMIVTVLTSMYILYKEWRRVERQGIHEIEGTDVHQIKLVLFAFLFITVSASDFLPNYGLEYYPIGVLCVVGFSSVITYTILRYNLHDIQVIVKRTLQFAGLVAVAAFVMVFIPKTLLQGIFHVPAVWADLFGVIIIAGGFDWVRSRLVEATEKFLFQKKYDYKVLLKRFTYEVMNILDLKQVGQMTVDTFVDTVKLDGASLLLLNKEKESNKYELVASKGKSAQQAVALDEQDPFVVFLRETHEPIGIDGELGKVQFPVEVRNRLKELNARLCLPLPVHEDLIGVLCLGNKKSDEEYTKDDLDILIPLARTLGIAVSNAKLVQENTQAMALASFREKQAMIGTLSAGINHEICNPLGIVKAQCEAYLLDSEDGILVGKSQQEILERTSNIMRVALKQIDRATTVTQTLSNFAKPIKEVKAQPVDIAAEVDEVLLLVGHDLKLDKIDVLKEIPVDIPKIAVDRRQLQQVLFNLIRNAGQAIAPPGKIWVRASVDAERVKIEITDTGAGIPPERLEKIGNPFFTTKEPGKGTGLGLFITRQLIESNKGRMRVESVVGKGTTFILDFPIAKEAALTASGATQ